MSTRAEALIGVAVLAALGWSGCRSSPTPDVLFGEAENLRLRYEKAATHEAITKYRAAIDVWQRQGQKRLAAVAWQRVGRSYEQLGSLNESLQSHLTALSLVDGSSEPLLESDIRSDVGVVRANAASQASMLADATRQCERALTLAKANAAARETAKALECLGEVSYILQEHKRALEFYRQAGAIADTLDDDARKAQNAVHQGHVYSDIGNLNEAQASFDRAEVLWLKLNDRRQQAIVGSAKARLEVRRGNYQKALNQFQETLATLKPIGDAVWEGSSLTGIAWVYEEMADWRPSLEYRERALELFEAAGLKVFAVEVRAYLGAMYLASGNHTAAFAHFERVLALADELGIERWRALALRHIGVVHLVRKQTDLAKQYFDRAFESLSRVSDPLLDRELRADLGETLELQGQHQSALVRFDEALSLSRSVGDRVTEARALFGLAQAASGLNDVDKARAYIEDALTVVESLRTAVENRDLRASYVARVYGYHELYVNLLARLNGERPGAGFSAKAFEASERARARSLLESLTESGVDLRAGIDRELLDREQKAQTALDDWARRSRQLSGDPGVKANTQRFAAEYRDLEERYSQIQAEIRSRSPRYAALARPQPLSLKEIQQQILDRDTVLLEYSLGEERSYLWTVSNDRHTMHELPGRAAIEQAARRVHERLTARLSAQGSEQERLTAIETADREYWQDAAQLSEMLLGPIAKAIAAKRLLVVTDGMLQYVPFAALPVPGSSGDPVPMLVQHEIVNLPSASVLAVLRREAARRAQPPKTVAVLADPVFESDDPRLQGKSASKQPAKPDTIVARSANSSAPPQTLRALDFIRDGRWSVPRLAATRQEADAIVAAALPDMSLKKIGFDASRSTALGPELAQYRIVHFATHGVVDNENPGLSGLIFSLFDDRGQPQDGFLRLHDIYTLQLPAELIVLSACNTALGKQLKGEGLMGMVRGFLYAGGKRVVASLWKVDDEATSELMRRFYDELLRKHQSPAAALRQAQIDMWKQDRWKPPFYWAAFSIQGEWK